MSSCLDSGCACVPHFSSQTCGILITTVPPPLLLSNIYRRFHSLCRDAGPLARLCLNRRLCRAPRASSPYLLGLVSRGGEAATLTTTGAPPASPCPPYTPPAAAIKTHLENEGVLADPPTLLKQTSSESSAPPKNTQP